MTDRVATENSEITERRGRSPIFSVRSVFSVARVLRAFFTVAIPLLSAAEPKSITALAFSPDGKALVAGSAREVRRWELPAGKPAAPIPLEFAKITSVHFDSAGKWLAVGGGHPGASGGVAILRWPEAGVFAAWNDHTDLVTAVGFDSASRRVVVSSADRRAEVFSWPEMQRLYQLDGHAGPILGAAFSPDDKVIVTVSADRSVKVWDTTDGSLKLSFSHHTDIVHGVAFRPAVFVDGQPVPFYCATASEDRTVRVWQPAIGRMVRIVRGHEEPVFAVAYSPTGDRLYSAGKEGIIRITDGDSDELVYHWEAHTDWIYALAVNPADGLLASADWAGWLRLWKIEAGRAALVSELDHP